MDKRKMLNNIKKKWNNPQQLLGFLMELDKHQEVDLELAYKRGMKETVTNYSLLFTYTLRKSGFGKKTLPLLIENINIISKQLENGELTLQKMNEELEKIGIHIS